MMASERVVPLVTGAAACALLAGTLTEGVVPSGQSAASGGVGPGTFARASLVIIALLSAVAVVRARATRSARDDIEEQPPAGLSVSDALRVLAIITSSILFGQLMIEVSIVLGVALLCVTWLLIAGERSWLRIVTVVLAGSAAACALVLVTGAQVERLVF